VHPAEARAAGRRAAGAHGPAHLDARIDAFLSGFEATLAKLAPEELERHREALVAAKLEKDRSLADEASRHWEQIASRRCPLRRCRGPRRSGEARGQLGSF